ncbi:MAG: hypothetical protein ABEJ07_04055 [Candidatus Nanohaloarchaea archaeon]
MVYENTARSAVYTVFGGDISGLAEKVTDFCHGEYGDRCEFYTVAVERHHPDGNSWTVHGFDSFDENAARAVENHLRARRDVVKLRFGASGTDYSLDFIICPARNTAQLARYVKKEHLESFQDDDLVVLSVERKRGEIDSEQRRMLEELE